MGQNETKTHQTPNTEDPQMVGDQRGGFVSLVFTAQPYSTAA